MRNMMLVRLEQGLTGRESVLPGLGAWRYQFLQEQTGLPADPGISWLSSSLAVGLSESDQPSQVFKIKGFGFYTHFVYILIHPLMISIKYIH